MKQKVQNIFFAVMVTIIFVAVLKSASARQDRIMSVDYCFDSEQNHYVAPDARCNN